jgi:hypothetical protein
MHSRKSFVYLASFALMAILILVPILSGCASSTPTTSAPQPTTSAPAPATSAPAPTSSAPAAAKELKIGVMVSFSGFFGGYSTAEWDECQTVAEIWNDRGGITVGGQKYTIKVISGDGKSALDGYTAATQKMILDEGIKFIAGPSAFFGGATNVISTPNKVIVSLGYNSLDPAQMNKDTIYTFNGGKGTIESGRGSLCDAG